MNPALLIAILKPVPAAGGPAPEDCYLTPDGAHYYCTSDGTQYYAQP